MSHNDGWPPRASHRLRALEAGAARPEGLSGCPGPAPAAERAAELRLSDIAAEATEVEQLGPLVGPHRLERLRPFIAVGLVCLAVVAADPNLSAAVRAAIAVATLPAMALAALAPWHRLPRSAQGYLMLLVVGLVIVLVVEGGELSSPYSWLAMLPTTWLVLYERMRTMVVALAALVVTFVVLFSLRPSLGALPGMLPPFIMCLLFPALHNKAREARGAMLAQAESAEHDPLTGVWNRRGLQRFADAKAPPTGAGISVIYLDVDGFKELNDTFGHDAGDELLRQVSSRLVAAVRAEDVVARVGGDEFVVITRGDPEAIEQIRARVERVANAQAYHVGGRAIAMAMSVGVRGSEQGHDLAALVQEADHAMFVAKGGPARRARPGGGGRDGDSMAGTTDMKAARHPPGG